MRSGAVSGNNDNSPSVPEWDAGSSLAAQLERAKEDLELVGYLISHDLKAPLRAIASACEALQKDPGLQGNKETHGPVREIARESARMKTLMQGLMDYLNLETFGPTRSLQDSNEIVATALTILEEKIQPTGAKITCDALPEVYGHRGRLTRLFTSLLDNALKFHGPVTQVRISARPAEEKHFVQFCVEDNGIGIDDEYHNIVFQLFQRLHTQEEYPGEGIGLALSRKIVESHGGRIWVESTLSEGSRFNFTLPTTRID